jgi:hypothetical protein
MKTSYHCTLYAYQIKKTPPFHAYYTPRNDNNRKRNYNKQNYFCLRLIKQNKKLGNFMQCSRLRL